MNEKMMKVWSFFSSLTPISKWEIVAYMVHMKLMGCMRVEKGCVEEEMRQTEERGSRPIGPAT